MASAPQIDFAALMAPVAERLLGSPNERLSRGHRLRFGNKGSIEVDTDEGWFDDHEAAVRGGVLELIRHKVGCDNAGAFRWLEDEGIKERTEGANRPRGTFADAIYMADRPAAQAQHRSIFYDYRNQAGAVAFRVERRGKDAVPPFLQHGPDRRGGFHAARGCMQGVQRLPYRLPELLAADPMEVVFVCEGEKDADRLAGMGLIATTNPGGAGKFTAELARWFLGRRVVALQDNDEAGAKHVSGILQTLTSVADQIGSLLLPGLPPKGDVSDWLDGGGTVENLRELAENALGVPATPETFAVADLTAWAVTAPTPKSFLMAGFVPEGEVTLLTGAGGVNKSSFGLQLCLTGAAGLPMLGIAVTPCSTLYVTAEDDDSQNHWRLRKMADWLRVPLESMSGKLNVVSLRGRLNNELATFDSEGRLHTAPAFELLRATIAATGSRLVVLDNVAHLYAGDENVRQPVTAFINLLYQLCRDLGCTVILIGHPNKAGDSYSGSTAWLNAVRSQMVISRPEGDADTDARVLTVGKANYASLDQQITFRWHDFALIKDSDLPKEASGELAATIAANDDNTIFLTCLAERLKQRRAVSEKRSPTFAPTEFAKMAESKRIGKARLEAAMDRLFRAGRIERGQLWMGDDRKPVFGLREAAGNGAVNTMRGTRETVREAAESRAGNAGEKHTYTTYSPGAAVGAAPSDRTGNHEAPNGGWNDNPALGRTRHPFLAPGEIDDEPIPGWEGL